MNAIFNLQSCPSEISFVQALRNRTIENSLYYVFTNHQGQTAAEFSLLLDNDILTRQTSILHIHGQENSWGLISADLLHKTCGPYPEMESGRTDPFDFVVRTFLLPILSILVLVTNTCVCMVFSRKHMLNPVFLILLIIGLIELANSLLPLPFYLAQSWIGRRTWWEHLPRQNFSIEEKLLQGTNWTLGPMPIYQTSSNALASLMSAWTTVFLPTVTHTCSVWLTITLALQRLIYVSRPNDTAKICTLHRSLVISLIILIGSFMIQLPLLCSHFVEFRPIQLRMQDDHVNAQQPNSLILSKPNCLSHLVTKLPKIVMKCHNLEPKYMLTYFYARLVLIHLMPCGILAILTSLLVWKMRQITQLRKRLNMNSAKESKPSSHIFSTSERSYQKARNLYRPFLCLKTCNKNTGTDSAGYINGSTQNNHNKLQNTSHQQSVALNKRKLNSMGSPQAISRMLIVVLIKFIAMHLPNAIALLVYVLITLRRGNPESSSSSPTSRSVANDLLPSGNWTKPETTTLAFPSSPSETFGTNSTNLTHISNPTINHWARLSTMCNLIILVSYQLNFLIYYIMSTAFRETFKQLCSIHLTCRSCVRIASQHSNSHQLSIPGDDTNPSNQTMNQTESGENDPLHHHHPHQHHQRTSGTRHLVTPNKQIIPILVETHID